MYIMFELNGNRIEILGTSHVSPQSVYEVTKYVNDNRPDIVCVELDRGRAIQLFRNQESSLSLSLIKRVGLTGYIFALIGNYVERKIAKKIGTKAGDDMKAGILAANKFKLPVAFIDQKIDVTLRKFSNRFTFKHKMKLLWFLFTSMFKKTDIQSFDIRGVPDTDQIDKIIQFLRPNFPIFYDVLIHERNVYMVDKLIKICKKEEDKLILAVVGAGHKKGMLELLEEAQKKLN